jgi:hypothetical protein
MKNLREKLTDILQDYGQIHEMECELNDEEGSFDGCTCSAKTMVNEIATAIIEHVSHDMDFKDEEQRKEAVKMMLGAYLV